MKKNIKNIKTIPKVAKKTVTKKIGKIKEKKIKEKKPVKKVKKKTTKKSKHKRVPPLNINNVNGGGRKPFDGKDEEIIVQKLENAFSSGATDEEACFYADISVRTLYYYCEKNPEFMQRKELLKKKLILQARNIVSQVMVEKDSGNQPTSRALDTSKWYLERKKKDEFAAQVNGIIDDGRSGGVLTEERKKAIADTMKAWSKNVKEDELDEDYDGKD